ncbi:drug resistance transporter, Bcr/CflA subfamily [compost metagenome]
MVLAAYVGGSALGLLLFGHLADHFDRKTLMVAALAAFAATSLAGAFAPDIAVLIGLRFLQGIAAALRPCLRRASSGNCSARRRPCAPSAFSEASSRWFRRLCPSPAWHFLRISAGNRRSSFSAPPERSSSS